MSFSLTSGRSGRAFHSVFQGVNAEPQGGFEGVTVWILWCVTQAEGGERWQRWQKLYLREVEARRQGSVGRAVYLANVGDNATVAKPYVCHLGGIGTPELPVSPLAVTSHYQNHGSPSDDAVYKDASNIIFPPDAVYPLRGPLCGVTVRSD